MLGALPMERNVPRSKLKMVLLKTFALLKFIVVLSVNSMERHGLLNAGKLQLLMQLQPNQPMLILMTTLLNWRISSPRRPSHSLPFNNYSFHQNSLIKMDGMND
eukprot:UN10477